MMLENSDRCAKHTSLLRPQDALRCACHWTRQAKAALDPDRVVALGKSLKKHDGLGSLKLRALTKDGPVFS